MHRSTSVRYVSFIPGNFDLAVRGVRMLSHLALPTCASKLHFEFELAVELRP